MKKILKQLLIPALTSRPVTAIADRLFNCGVPIFMLHRIEQPDESNTGKITSAHLRSCLNYLIEQNYTFITLKDLILRLKQKIRNFQQNPLFLPWMMVMPTRLKLLHQYF